jgi:hypothetical protein
MAEATNNYEAMTVEELDARLEGLAEEKERVRDEMRAVAEIRDTKLLREQARRKVAQMGDIERAALAQAVTEAGGVDASQPINPLA